MVISSLALCSLSLISLCWIWRLLFPISFKPTPRELPILLSSSSCLRAKEVPLGLHILYEALFSVTQKKIMRIVAVARSFRARPTLPKATGHLQVRAFQPDFKPRDPKAKPIRYKYPEVYNPYGPRPPPSDKIVQLAERIAALAPAERCQLGPALVERLKLPQMQHISTEGMDLGPQGGAAGASKAEEKKVEKTAFDVKLEKFEASAKIKVIKEVRAFTSLGLKEAKDLVEKAPCVLKQGLTKEEANDMIEKLKAAGGVAVME